MLSRASFTHLRLPRSEADIIDLVVADPLIYHVNDIRTNGLFTVVVEERITGHQYRLQFTPTIDHYWTLDGMELFLEHAPHPVGKWPRTASPQRSDLPALPAS